MPDFDTRKPQESNEPSRSRIRSIANRLSSLLSASKIRIQSIARTIRRPLMANRNRTLLIGGGLLFVMVAVPVGLLIYSSGEFGHAQQTGGQQDIRMDESQKGKLIFQLSGYYSNTLVYAISGMDTNGSSLERFTDTVDKRSMGYSNEDPARSPDLKKIAFTRVVSEYPASVDASASASARAGPSYIQVPHVFVMNSDGSHETQLGDMAAAKPDWSPDGQQIVFSSDEDWTSSGISDEGACDLYVTSVDGSGTPKKLTNGTGCESNPSWSPDGTKIAYTRDLGNDLDIYVIDVCCEEGDTNQSRRLTEDPVDDTDPAWSPDGTKIAFTRSVRDIETNIVTNDPVKPPESDVYKMDADGSGQTRLTYSKATEAQPTWSPDGTKIAFTRQAFPGASLESDSMNATTGIFTMDSDGTDPAVIKIFQSEIASYPEWGVTASQDTGAEQAVEGEPTEEAIADWRVLDARLPDVAVQVYIEEMNELLRGVNPHDSLATTQESLAMYMTSSVMKGLDPSGKEKVVQYLAESGLLTSIPLNGVDLRGTDLSNANLSHAQWSDVKLSGVKLSNADLSGASLYGANLSNADLSGADLSDATLEQVDLRGGDLSDADLSRARLLGAKVTAAQLAEAQSLAGTLMPDGSQHP
jgi:Tol biopolymer transport system component